MKNCKIMIIVPHEDDELNIAGGLLLNSNFDKNNCFVVFMTNGDYGFQCRTRIKEAMKSCRYLDIPKNNIIFMGYPDQHFNASNHVYHTMEGIFTSKSNHQETYCYKVDDFHYKKFQQHSLYTYDNLLNDFILLIKEYNPDIFYVIDFDSHPDHRCCSLIFEKALGMYLKENPSYFPTVYKGFAYPTAYHGLNDFDSLNLESTKFVTEKHSLAKYGNPYYNWKDRVRFPVSKSSRNRILLFNRWYWAIKKHRSQITLLRNCKCIINNDQIFWQRRTNNLARLANITVSSGDKKYLDDFLLFDCKNILDGNVKTPELLESFWQPDSNDKEKTITYTFNDCYDITEIVLYQNCSSKEFIKKINIKLNNSISNDYNLNNYCVTTITLNSQNVKELTIKILDKNLKNSGFSEIEIFTENCISGKFLKILNYDNFMYNNYLYDTLNINVYYYNGVRSEYLPYDRCDFYVDNMKVNCHSLSSITKKNFMLKVELKEDRSIFDQVLIKKIDIFDKSIFQIIRTVNNITLKIDILKNRIINKIQRILKRI